MMRGIHWDGDGFAPIHELCKAHDSRALEGPRLRFSTYLCTWIPTVGPLRGRGPRPLCPSSAPLPQCNTVWHTHPRLIICPAAVAHFDTPA